jgi:tetratricopeptide (TPR) repeat protein
MPIMNRLSISAFGLIIFVAPGASGQIPDARTMGGSTSQIMRGMTFGSGSGQAVTPPAPVLPGGVNTLPNCNIGCRPGQNWGGNGWGCNTGWGWNTAYYGFPYAGWGYNYGTSVGFQQGYYQGAVDRENQLLREELLRQQWQMEQDRLRNNQAIGDAKDNNLPVPPRAVQRERVERNRAEASLKSGMRHFQRGAYTQAAQKFEQARNLPNASAMFLAGQAYIAAGQFDRAVDAIKEGLDQNPGWPTAEVDLRALYPNGDDLLAQMGTLAKRLKEQPNNADLMFLLGFELFGAGERDKARAILDQAARLSADDRHLKPFFDFYASLEGGTPNGPRDETTPAEDVPIPDVLREKVQERTKRS